MRVAVARPIGRGLFRPFPDTGEDPNAGLEVTLRNILDQLGAQVVSRVENLVENGFGTALEMNGFTAAILGGPAALDPAVFLQPVEETGQGGSFDAHPLGNFFLGKFVATLGKMNKRAPFPLAQPERPEALIEPGAPGPGGAEEDEAELVDVGWRHAELISVLTNRIPAALSNPLPAYFSPTRIRMLVWLR